MVRRDGFLFSCQVFFSFLDSSPPMLSSTFTYLFSIHFLICCTVFFSDVAIGCPFGGEDKQGVVKIYNGHSGGLQDKPSQVISGQWASTTIPASFGFTLRGNKDLDMNGYPG